VLLLLAETALSLLPAFEDVLHSAVDILAAALAAAAAAAAAAATLLFKYESSSGSCTLSDSSRSSLA
jgi:hypothetical protein